jgi:hypothetical protein
MHVTLADLACGPAVLIEFAAYRPSRTLWSGRYSHFWSAVAGLLPIGRSVVTAMPMTLATYLRPIGRRHVRGGLNSGVAEPRKLGDDS